MATMDAETKLRIKLLPIIGDVRVPGPSTGGSTSLASSTTSSPRTIKSCSTSATPRLNSKSGSKQSTPRSKSCKNDTLTRVGGSKLSTPRSLLVAAAQKSAGAPRREERLEIHRRAQQTTFTWRTSNNVKLATYLPEELLRYRHNHEFDKYGYCSIWASQEENKLESLLKSSQRWERSYRCA